MKTYMMNDLETGDVIAEIKCNSVEDINLFSDKFLLKELTGQVEAVDTITFGEE